MTSILTVAHISVSLFLIVIVLLQHGKGADAGAAFGGGGGSNQSLFGSEGPVPLLNKITTASAILFMVTSVSLAYISSTSSTGSLMNTVPQASLIDKNAGSSTEQIVPMPTSAPEEDVQVVEESKVQE